MISAIALIDRYSFDVSLESFPGSETAPGFQNRYFSKHRMPCCSIVRSEAINNKPLLFYYIDVKMSYISSSLTLHCKNNRNFGPNVAASYTATVVGVSGRLL